MFETILFLLLLVIMLYTAHRLFFQRDSNSVAPGEWEQGNGNGNGNGNGSSAGGLSKSLRTLKLEIEPLVFVAAIGMIAVIVFLLFLELFPDSIALAFIAALALIIFAFSLLGDLAKWRARRFESGLVDAIDLIQAALQSGENPREALRTAADVSKGSVKAELDEQNKRLELGMPIEKSTARMVELYDSESVRLFTQVLVAKWNAGGDLLMLLRSVNRIIRDRIKLRLKVNGQLSGARYALMFVALIPYLVIPVFLWKAPGWLQTLTDHPMGPTFLLAAVLLQVAGFFWMRRILRTDQ